MKQEKSFSLRKITLIFLFLLAIPTNQTFGLKIPSPKKIIKSIGNGVSSGFSKLIITDNFHTVENGQLYRSKQFSAKKLKKYIYKYGIKTVVNLRGINDDGWWYAERDLCKEMGIKLFNIPMSAKQLPTKKQIEKILDIFDNAPRPILTHCRGGADRTGMISGLWALDQQHRCTKNALKQLSVLYGHIKPQYPHMDNFIKMWQGRSWFFNEYDL